MTHFNGKYFRQTIIALSASVAKQNVNLSLQAGMNDYLSKPVKTEKLARVITEVHKQKTQSSDSNESRVIDA